MSVQLLVELQDVVAVDVQGIIFSVCNLLEKRDVNRLSISNGHLLLWCQVVVIEIIDVIEGDQEITELVLEAVSVDVGTPENLGVRRHLGIWHRPAN